MPAWWLRIADRELRREVRLELRALVRRACRSRRRAPCRTRRRRSASGRATPSRARPRVHARARTACGTKPCSSERNSSSPRAAPIARRRSSPSAQREAGERRGHAHHVLLVEHHAVRGGEHRLERAGAGTAPARARGARRQNASFMPDSAGPGPHQRDRGDRLVERARLEHAQQVAHRGRLELEAVERVAAREPRSGRGVAVVGGSAVRSTSTAGAACARTSSIALADRR